MIDSHERENRAEVLNSDNFWKKDLNATQWNAVKECSRPLLVIAGAGSGKTRVLTYKVAYLLEHGYQPWEVMALTFTNKAAREMNERIAHIVGMGKAKGLWSGTFHSLFARILREEHEAIGMKRDFSIYDSSDSKSLLKTIIKEMGLDDKVYKPSRVQGRISEAKNRLLLPQDYAADTQRMERDQRDNLGEIQKIYAQYFMRCRVAGALDFDDLLLYTYLLFEHNEKIRCQYNLRFRYILVDEYQDTNYAQHTIISQLTRDHHNICVVGDDAQSIYAFRGANIANILHFHKQYPQAMMIKLEQNYRSTQNIVNAANSIIVHNKEQIEKNVFSNNDEGEKITLISAASDREEAAKIVGLIGRLKRQENLEYNNIALLYRTNSQSRVLEDALRENNLPYRIYGGLSFYQRKEIKDILAYCRLLYNLDDEEAFKRIVNYPTRGIGNTTLQKIFTASRLHNLSLWEVLQRLEELGVRLQRGTLNKLGMFCQLIERLRAKTIEMGAFDFMIHLIQETGIRDDLNKEDGAEGECKRDNVEELLNSVRSFEQDMLESLGKTETLLYDFLQQSALQTDVDKEDENVSKITLMTIHAAKGLEFEAVFVTGVEEGLFPAQQARFFPKEMEEERRLFYVAVTRAKRFCFLSFAKSRYRYGMLEVSEESPFIKEIDKRFVQDYSLKSVSQQGLSDSLRRAIFSSESDNISTYGQSYSSTITARPTLSSSGSCTLQKLSTVMSKKEKNNIPLLSVGQQIVHERFGKGTVIAMEGAGDNAKAMIKFEAVGTKNLLLKFAKFKLLDS